MPLLLPVAFTLPLPILPQASCEMRAAGLTPAQSSRTDCGVTVDPFQLWCSEVCGVMRKLFPPFCVSSSQYCRAERGGIGDGWPELLPELTEAGGGGNMACAASYAEAGDVDGKLRCDGDAPNWRAVLGVAAVPPVEGKFMNVPEVMRRSDERGWLGRKGTPKSLPLLPLPLCCCFCCCMAAAVAAC